MYSIYTLYIYTSNGYIQWIYPHHPRCFPAEPAPAVGQFSAPRWRWDPESPEWRAPRSDGERVAWNFGMGKRVRYSYYMYPLVNSHITMENHHCSWENSLFLWPFSIAMLNYQRATTNNSWKGLTFHVLTFWFFTGCLSSRTCAALFSKGSEDQGLKGATVVNHPLDIICNSAVTDIPTDIWLINGISHCGIYGLYGLYMDYIWVIWVINGYTDMINHWMVASPTPGSFSQLKHQGRPSEMHLAVNAARRFRLIWWPSTGIIPWLGKLPENHSQQSMEMMMMMIMMMMMFGGFKSPFRPSHFWGGRLDQQKVVSTSAGAWWKSLEDLAESGPPAPAT